MSTTPDQPSKRLSPLETPDLRTSQDLQRNREDKPPFRRPVFRIPFPGKPRKS